MRLTLKEAIEIARIDYERDKTKKNILIEKGVNQKPETIKLFESLFSHLKNANQYEVEVELELALAEYLKSDTSEETLHNERCDKILMFQEFYNQVEKHFEYFREGGVSSELKDIYFYAIKILIELEEKKIDEIIDEMGTYLSNTFIHCITLKYISSAILNKEIISHFNINQQFNFFRLWCADTSKTLIKSIGFEFKDAKNILGWELIKDENIEYIEKPVDKFNWTGNQASLLYLFKTLRKDRLIDNHNYIEVLTNTFTVNDKAINRDSIKSALNKAKIKAEKYIKVKDINVKVNALQETIIELNKIV